MTASRIFPGRWADSAKLMSAARKAKDEPGVAEAACFMATPANKAQAVQLGLSDSSVAAAGADDLVIAVSGDGAQAGLDAAVAALETPPASNVGTAVRSPRSLTHTQADLALVSVPGEYAALEAHKALGRGMDVLLFSDGVTEEEELGLKRRAHELGRIVMGPGCGTAIIDGVGLGFANVVAKGRVGVVAAAGTGAQEATVLLDRAGVGVSQCYGTGGHDLHTSIGAITMIDAIGRLADDPATEVILCVSKPPDPEVAERVIAALAATGKPAAACFVGSPSLPEVGGVDVAPTLEAASASAARLAGGTLDIPPDERAEWVVPGHIRGLFSGGTLCGEAVAILADRVGKVGSNAPAGKAYRLEPGQSGGGHICLDLGEEEYTRGRPHPMIDPAARAELLEEVTRDPDVGVILVDVVLGHASHADPAGAIAPVLAAALKRRSQLRAVAHVCGTEADPQVRSTQVAALTAAGVRVCETNAAAARLAAALVGVA